MSIGLITHYRSIMRKEIRMTPTKSKLQDILLMITWGKISNQYFGKSSSWIYNKMNGRDGNGGEGAFTPEETIQLKEALYDFAERVKRCANEL